MLDNGVYEVGKPLNCEDLIKVAEAVKADEIVLPDFLYRCKETLQAVTTFVQTVSKRFKYAAVPQGEDPLEWIECYNQLKHFDDINTLCIPIWLQKRFGCRPSVVHYLLKKGWWARYKEHHLIGLDGLGELYCYGIYQGLFGKPLIRSVDTSLPFSRTAANLDVTFEDSKVSRISFDNPKVAFGSDSVERLKRNINALLKVAHEI